MNGLVKLELEFSLKVFSTIFISYHIKTKQPEKKLSFSEAVNAL